MGARGWDADYYDNEVALAAPGELIEAVIQDANGAARGCLLVEVIGAPSQLNSQNFQACCLRSAKKERKDGLPLLKRLG